MNMSIKRILFPIDFPNTSSSVTAQVAYLARHFHCEIVLFHVVSPWSYSDAALEDNVIRMEHDLRTAESQPTQQNLHHAQQAKTAGLAIRRVVCNGDPAREILRAAREEHVDLIVMSTRHHGILYRLLIGSVTAKVLHDGDCPVWTDAQANETAAKEFAIRSVLCAIDLSPHSPHTLTQAAQFASEFDARLTLVHVTAGVETFGPGGDYVVPEWKNVLVGSAAKEMAKLQQGLDIRSDVIIESGHVQVSLNRAAAQSKADLLIVGHPTPAGHLGDNGNAYSVIRDSLIPVLSL
jgi:nucleotide-binding universal stress UspA family protein